MKLIDTDIAIDHFHGHRQTFEYFTQTLIGMELADAIVAATAFVAGAEVVTRNVKHYPMGDVQIVSPYERAG